TDRRHLIAQAEAALASAKRHGRTTVEVFDPARHRAPGVLSSTAEASAAVAETMTNKLIRPVFQPIVDLRPLELPDFSLPLLVRPLHRAGLEPDRVVIEITERETIEEMERLKRNVGACRAAGFRVAADDVGAGNAGLRLLSQVQFDIVKVDLSLVQDGALYETSLAVVGSLQELARRWGAWV